MPDECGAPLTVLLAADEDILRTGRAQVGGIERSVIIQAFGIADADGVALLALRHERHPARDILSEVDDEGWSVEGGGRRENSFATGVFSLHTPHSTLLTPHSRHHLCAEGTRRNSRTLCLLPGGVVEAHLVPARHLHAGIIFLAVVFIVGTDRAIGRHLPRLVGLYALRRAILIFDDDVDPALGQSEGGVLVRLVLTHGEVAPIAKHDADAVVLPLLRRTVNHLILQCFRDVVCVIVDGLAVVRRHGLQHADVIA